MFRATMGPSSGETIVFLWHLVLVILCTLHTIQSSTQNNKYQMSHKHSCFSWWWAHSRPKYIFFFPQCHHMFWSNFVVSLLGGDSVADFRGWDVHEARLRCPDDVSGDMQEDEVPGGALRLNLLTTQTMVTHGNFSPARKNPRGRSGTSWLVVRDPDH